MARPGFTITKTSTGGGRGGESPTGSWFAVGLTEKGPTVPTVVHSNAEFKRYFGGLNALGVLADTVEDYFAEGGSRAVIGRLVGSGAVAATKTVASMKFTASSVGEWGNSLKVAVEAGGSEFAILVTDSSGNLLDKVTGLTSLAAAVAWAESSAYVRIELVGETFPVTAAAAALTGGEDKHSTVANADWQAALARFTTDLGPGQVSTPGRTGAQAATDLASHAATHNRIAYLDVAITDDTFAELKAAASTARSGAGANVESAAIFGPWNVIPGVAPGTYRKIPASGAEAGKASRVDAQTGNPNIPAAGDNGLAQYAVDLVATGFTDEQRGELNEAGLNLVRKIGEDIKTYGFRTLADKYAHPNGWQLGNARLSMAIEADCEAVAERHVFRQIDGDEIEISRFRGDLEAVLSEYHNLGALYGPTPAEAFSVDTGPDVNSAQSLAEGTLAAVLKVRRSPFAELVEITIAAVYPTASV